MPTQINGNTGVDQVQMGVVTPDDLNTMVNPSVQRIQTFTALTATGTSVDFTGIPSWAKEITVMFNGVSTNGSSSYLVQIGSGSIQNTGYASVGGVLANAAASAAVNSTAGFAMFNNSASNITHAIMTVENISGNTWVASHSGGYSNLASATSGGGSVTLAGVLDRIRITTVNGTDTFDAGSINILVKG
jgi:hypothetical protein